MPIQQMFLGAGGAAPAEPLGSIPVTSSLLWYYDGYYVTESGGQLTQWTDQSGNGRHQSVSGGRMGNGLSQHEALKGERYLTKARKYIRNDTAGHGMRWNGSGWWPGTSYTLMHICARGSKAGADGQGRIVDGFGINWLSGYHDTAEGSFYHDGWIIDNGNDRGTGQNFLVCIDRLNSVRAKGKHGGGATDSGYATSSGHGAPSTNAGIGINCGQYTGDIGSTGGGENCDWECIMIACWSGNKSDSDCNTLMNWGYDKLYG